MRENVGLAPYTTLGVGGPARFFVRAEREAELVEAVRFARRLGLPVFVLGGGSNLLVADEGFAGVAIQAAIGVEGVAEFSGVGSEVEVEVAAGVDWDAFVRGACEAGLSGVECLAGIPGMVGGSPVQNIGAYGQEVAQTIVSVRVLDLETLAMRELGAEECGFGYRRSVFNSTERGRFVVCGVRFRLGRDHAPKLRYGDLLRHFGGRAAPGPMEIYEAVRGIRRAKGMLLLPGDAEGGDGDFRSAGSFFKNPVVGEEMVRGIAGAVGCGVEEVPRYPAEGVGRVKLSAAWLIERAGFARGFAMGRAGLSTRHVLAVVNRGGATAREIVALRDVVVGRVRERFGVGLEQEPVMVGFDDGKA